MRNTLLDFSSMPQIHTMPFFNCTKESAYEFDMTLMVSIRPDFSHVNIFPHLSLNLNDFIQYCKLNLY